MNIDILSLLNNSLMAALASAGFAMLFNVPRRALPLSAMCGAVGVCSRMLFLHYGQMHVAMATLGAAIFVAALAELLSSRMNMPPSLFSVAGVIPMVPGGLMFRSVVYWLNIAASDSGPFDEALFGAAWSLTGTAFLVLSALALGIAAPNLIFYRRRPEA